MKVLFPSHRCVYNKTTDLCAGVPDQLRPRVGAITAPWSALLLCIRSCSEMKELGDWTECRMSVRIVDPVDLHAMTGIIIPYFVSYCTKFCSLCGIGCIATFPHHLKRNIARQAGGNHNHNNSTISSNVINVIRHLATFLVCRSTYCTVHDHSTGRCTCTSNTGLLQS